MSQSSKQVDWCLRKAKKDIFLDNIMVTSRSRKEGDKRVTYAIYLSKIKPKMEESERKKKAK